MSAAGDVSAVLVTRGDVDLSPLVASLSVFAEVVVWDNNPDAHPELAALPVVWANTEGHNLSVYGRYAALRACRGAVVYVQDDDCLLPQESLEAIVAAHQSGHVVCNLPGPFRAFYDDSALVGFGAVFERDLAARAFERFRSHWFSKPAEYALTIPDMAQTGAACRCSDVIFTTLTPRILVDVPYELLPYATGPDRMYRQPTHVGERARMLDLARKVRDA